MARRTRRACARRVVSVITPGNERGNAGNAISSAMTLDRIDRLSPERVNLKFKCHRIDCSLPGRNRGGDRGYKYEINSENVYAEDPQRFHLAVIFNSRYQAYSPVYRCVLSVEKMFPRS